MMKRIAALLGGLLLLIPMSMAPAMAGNPHFVGQTGISATADTLTVSGKIAGLGNETQVHVVVTADAQCVNPGNNEPRADNKDSFSAEGDFPVQNGKALFALVLTAEISPNCTPPMTIVWSNVTVTDEEHGLSRTFPGPYSA